MSNRPLDAGYVNVLKLAAVPWGVEDYLLMEQKQATVNTYAYEETEIQTYQFAGAWGYCLHLRCKNGGMGFGPFPKFSKPYASNFDALCAAVARVKEYVDSRKDRELIKWVEALIIPAQLSLLEE